MILTDPYRKFWALKQKEKLTPSSPFYLMRKDWFLSQEAFDALLKWLDSDREQAAMKYEEIRKRLIKIFTGRDCVEAEDLADETINRVVSKLDELERSSRVIVDVTSSVLPIRSTWSTSAENYLNRRRPTSRFKPDRARISLYGALY